MSTRQFIPAVRWVQLHNLIATVCVLNCIPNFFFFFFKMNEIYLFKKKHLRWMVYDGQKKQCDWLTVQIETLQSNQLKIGVDCQHWPRFQSVFRHDGSNEIRITKHSNVAVRERAREFNVKSLLNRSFIVRSQNGWYCWSVWLWHPIDRFLCIYSIEI